MEVGFLVAEPQKGSDRVKQSVLPGGKMVTAMHKWMEAKSLKPKKVMWERYLNGPDTVKDPSEYIAQLFCPIE